MKVRWVVICQYRRPRLAPPHSDSYPVYLSSHGCAAGGKRSAGVFPGSLLCSPNAVFVFLEARGGGCVEGGGGVGDSKFWQIAENCLHTVIPVWTHLAHLVVIWQQKRRGGGLSSQSGATYYSPPPPPLSLSLSLSLSFSLSWFGL